MAIPRLLLDALFYIVDQRPEKITYVDLIRELGMRSIDARIIIKILWEHRVIDVEGKVDLERAKLMLVRLLEIWMKSDEEDREERKQKHLQQEI